MLNKTILIIVLSPFLTALCIALFVALICIAPFYFLNEAWCALLDFIDKGRSRKDKIKAYELKKNTPIW